MQPDVCRRIRRGEQVSTRVALGDLAPVPRPADMKSSATTSNGATLQLSTSCEHLEDLHQIPGSARP